jgi:predicted enzyme related to lactoylglutathione lyase
MKQTSFQLGVVSLAQYEKPIRLKYKEDRFTNMPTVYHFDIPVDDANRAQQFYKDVFGWDMKKMTSQVDPNIELWMCETEDENGRKGITG